MRERRDTSPSGVALRYLDRDGDIFAEIEIRNGEAVAVLDTKTGNELPLEILTTRDAENALAQILDRI